MKKSTLIATSAWLAWCAGCTLSEQDTTRIEVPEPNALGVVTLEISRFDAPGASVFELRGLDAAVREVALVRQRVGVIADLGQFLPAGDLVGSEYTFRAGDGAERRAVSRETSAFQFAPFRDDPDLQGFLESRTVAAALDQAHIHVQPAFARAAGERAYGWVALNDVGSCAAGQLNTTPVAAQCCFTEYGYYDDDSYYTEGRYQDFIASSGMNSGLAIQKILSPTSFSTSTCVSSTGGSCSGSACYYGPNGFARPFVWPGSSGFTVNTYTAYNVPDSPMLGCAFTQSGGDSGEYGSVTGTFPTSQGCPGGTSGAGDWDY